MCRLVDRCILQRAGGWSALMQVGYCEKCGGRVVVAEPEGELEHRAVLCDECRRRLEKEGTAGKDVGPGAGTSAAGPLRSGEPQPARLPEEKPVPALDGPGGLGGLGLGGILLATVAGVVLVLAGLAIGYFIRGAGEGMGEEALIVATRSGPQSPGGPVPRAPSPSPPPAPVPATVAQTAPARGEPSARPSSPPLAAPRPREPIGGWGEHPPEKPLEVPETASRPDEGEKGTAPASGETAAAVSGEAAASGAAASPQAGGGGEKEAEEAVATPAGPVATEVEKKEPPRMPAETAALIAAASRTYRKYRLLEPAIRLCRSYRFRRAAERLRKVAGEDETCRAALGEVERVARTMKAVEEGIKALQGKEVEIRMPVGRQRGTVRGYSAGMVMLQTAGGYPSAVSLKKLPFGLLAEWTKGVSEEDLVLFSVYAGRGLPEGKEEEGLSEAARLVLRYPEWSEREKKAGKLLGRIRALREEGKWPEVIAAAVEAASKYMDTYAVGVKARGELGAWLREALVKKKKTVAYRYGESPSGDYEEVKDTYISVNGGEKRGDYNEFVMNFGKSDVLMLWSNSRRTLIRFELVGLPEDVRVLKATLELYCPKLSYAEVAEAAVYLAGESWEEGNQRWGRAKSGATWEFRDAATKKYWSEKGGPIVARDFGHPEVGLVARCQFIQGKWTKVEVTKAVEAWLSGAVPNHGFMLMLAGKREGWVGMASSQAPDVSTRPRLVLEYEGTVQGQEAVVPERLQWLLYEEGGAGSGEVLDVEI